jgi:hypothetical protein
MGRRIIDHLHNPHGGLIRSYFIHAQKKAIFGPSPRGISADEKLSFHKSSFA